MSASRRAVDHLPPDRAAGASVVRRRSPEVRKGLLVDAARSVIAARGLHATTVRHVAAAGGVSVGTLTYHFNGIEEVLAGVLEAEMSTYSAPIWSAAALAIPGRAGLAALVDGLLASDERAVAHWKLWLDFWAMAAHHPRYAVWQAEVYRDMHALLAGILRSGRADGSLGVVDADAEAIEFVALLDGLVVQAYLPDSRLTPAAARRVLHGYVSAVMGPDRVAIAVPDGPAEPAR